MASTPGLFNRLAKTRQSLGGSLMSIFSSATEIDDAMFDDIEDQLLVADVGFETTQAIMTTLRQTATRNNCRTADQLLDGLRGSLVDLLESGPAIDSGRPMDSTPISGPQVILMVGVNGVGKTTTLGKLANLYHVAGNRVMLAACDTYRAAAIDQLRSWGERLEIPVIAQEHGSDAAAVAFDAYRAACAREMDYLLIDTAGRQHTQGSLMDQLKKIKRVLEKANPDIPHEVFMTVDAGNGQNVISQVENFSRVISLTGLCVTKLDGTAKGGVLFALVSRFGLPIRYVGIGEGLDDLKPFVASDFVDALLPQIADGKSP
jgi:fused signal recognition particle receptor